MKILLVTRWFSVNTNDTMMPHDLAYALRDAGHDVRVLCTEWKGQERTGLYNVNNIEVWWYNQEAPRWLPSPLKTPYKMLHCSGNACHHFSKELDSFSPDTVIMFSFASAYTSLLSYFRKRPKTQLSLLLWDFFPYHHFNIRGINNGIVIKFMTWLESKQLDKFQVIGLMTPRNLEYFQQAYPLVQKPKLVISPIWGPPSHPKQDKMILRKKFNLPTDKVISVFGGTLSLGRGIDEILALARESQQDIEEAFFIIIGDGPLRPKIKAFIKEHDLSNILCLKRLERDDYQGFIASCDIGIVSTASDMSFIAPFPSKSIDYFRNHLAILASVEPTTDYGEILETEILGGLSSHSGDLKSFKANLERMVRDSNLRQKMAANGTRYLEETLAVDKIADSILKNLS